MQKERERQLWHCDAYLRLPVRGDSGRAKATWAPQLSMARSRRSAEGLSGFDIPMP